MYFLLYFSLEMEYFKIWSFTSAHLSVCPLVGMWRLYGSIKFRDAYAMFSRTENKWPLLNLYSLSCYTYGHIPQFYLGKFLCSVRSFNSFSLYSCLNNMTSLTISLKLVGGNQGKQFFDDFFEGHYFA